jgi:hypothetical protein
MFIVMNKRSGGITCLNTDSIVLINGGEKEHPNACVVSLSDNTMRFINQSIDNVVKLISEGKDKVSITNWIVWDASGR